MNGSSTFGLFRESVFEKLLPLAVVAVCGRCVLRTGKYRVLSTGSLDHVRSFVSCLRAHQKFKI